MPLDWRRLMKTAAIVMIAAVGSVCAAGVVFMASLSWPRLF